MPEKYRSRQLLSSTGKSQIRAWTRCCYVEVNPSNLLQKLYLNLKRIKKFPGELETLLRCEIELSVTTSDKPWVKPPISMEFQVINYLMIAAWLFYMEKGAYVHSFRIESQIFESIWEEWVQANKMDQIYHEGRRVSTQTLSPSGFRS